MGKPSTSTMMMSIWQTNNTISASKKKWDFAVLSTVYVTQWQIKDYPTVLALYPAPPAALIGKTGGACTQDYITIEGGSEICGSPIFYSKFCGDVLSTYSGGAAPAVNNPICDCSPPFMVGIFTNAADADADGDGTI